MLKVVLIGLFAVLLFYVVLTLWTGGAFTKLTPHSPGELYVVRGLVGAEDLTIDRQSKKAIVSCDDRRATMAKKPVKGAVYLLDYRAEPPVVANLTAGFEQDDFHPHGISLYRDPTDGSGWLFVINHRESGQFVELFKYDGATLEHAETFRDPLFISPNDIVAVGPRQFYFTNDHDSKGAGAVVKDLLRIGSGQVCYFDGEKAEVLDKGIGYANGINVSKDGEHLYVAACTDRELLVYQREPFKKLGSVFCNTCVDNIEVDERGDLWIGSHPNMIAFLGHAQKAEKRSPSQILRVRIASDIEDSEVKEIYLSDGRPLSGSSAAAYDPPYILMGTVFEDGVGVLKNG